MKTQENNSNGKNLGYTIEFKLPNLMNLFPEGNNFIKATIHPQPKINFNKIKTLTEKQLLQKNLESLESQLNQIKERLKELD